jgi:Bacterial Ig domain
MISLPVWAGVTVTSPGASSTSPVHFVASATSNHPITAMRIYVDNVSRYTVGASKLDTYLSIAAGSHYVVVQAWNSTGAVLKTARSLTITTSSTQSSGVTISSPTPGSTVSSPIHFVASAKSAHPITAMSIYLDNNSVYTVGASSLDTSVNASSGSHSAVVQAWDSTGAVFKSALTVNVASAPSSSPAAMTSPASGSTLPGASVNFAWSAGSGVSQYSLAVGTSLGASDIYGQQLTATSAGVSGLPTDGRAVYARLGSLIGSSWTYQDYSYKAYTAPATPPPPTGSCGSINVGNEASLNGFVPFLSTSPWNQDISSTPVDPNSSAIINFIGSTVAVHPDFGTSYGIPYVGVANQAKVNVTSSYADESDPGPMPIPVNAPIEGGSSASGDRHVLVVDATNCWLYELYNSQPNNDGSWNADAAIVWDLTSNEQRPWTWTSADAAGLPILPGLVRYDEVASGHINHAIRFTLKQSRAAMIPPASHWAANSTNSLAAPMGMRLRLKASVDISKYSAANQVILTALKKYGLIMADNGSNMYITGTTDSRWDDNDLHALGGLHASDFEVVQMNPVYTSANLPKGSAPAISGLTASATTVSAGTKVSLTWNASNASYVIVSPQVGPVRGSSVTVTPSATTTYTVYATNQYGRSSATITIKVQ